MITKIISGGQTGADIAAVMAAKDMHYTTGGWMPKGFKTLNGCRPEYEECYGFKEHECDTYPPRTEQNVIDSDGTLRIAGDFKSAGEKCTLRFIKKHHKPYFDIDVENPPNPTEVLRWIYSNNIQILNVAGNSEKTWPGIQKFVYKYMTSMLKDIEILKIL